MRKCGRLAAIPFILTGAVPSKHKLCIVVFVVLVQHFLGHLFIIEIPFSETYLFFTAFG